MASKPLDALTRFEALAERWLEGGFARLFRASLHPAELMEQLARALEDGRILGSDGVWLAPDEYHVRLHPDDLARLGEQQERAEIEKELATYLMEIAQKSGATLTRRPHVHLHASDGVVPRQVQVQAHLSVPLPAADTAHDTQEIDAYGSSAMAAPERLLAVRPGTSAASIPSRADPESRLEPLLPAQDESVKGRNRWTEGLKTDTGDRACYLVVGERRFALTASPVSLGRSLDNDVVIEHPRVSRHHVLLQVQGDQWWLMDLNSANGTTLNDQPIGEAVLHPGDVISLAGFEIHVEGQASEAE